MNGEAGRLAGLDALRVAAMLLVVGLHSALAYVSVPIPGLLWPLRDDSTWFGFDLFVWWALGTSMPIFFFLAGFLCGQACRRRGLAATADDRTRRIGGPLLLGVLAVLPPTLWVWSQGWIKSGRAEPAPWLAEQFHDPSIESNVIGPGHLWFLSYLLVILAALGLAAWVGGGWLALVWRRSWRPIFAGGWAPVLLAVPTAAIAWAGHERVGLDPVMMMANDLWPSGERLLHHGWFVAAGLGAATLPRFLCRRWLRLAPWYLLASVPAFAVRALLLDADLRHPLDPGRAAVMAVASALFAWLTLFGMLGVCVRCVRRTSRVIHSLSRASLWIYLWHFPIVGLIQVDLYRSGLPLGAAGKFATTLAIALATCWAGHWVVRQRSFGRKPRPSTARVKAEIAAATANAVA